MSPVLPVSLADFGCVPVRGVVGVGIEFGQWLNGDGFRDYEHALLYAGYYTTTPNVDPRWLEGSGPGHYVMEAQLAGARMRRLAYGPIDYPGARWSSGHIRLSPSERQAILHSAIELLGTPYSGLDYGALAAHRLKLHPLDYALKARIESDKHLICSQMVDLAYNRGLVHLFRDGRWPGYVTPLDLAKLTFEETRLRPGRSLP